jgi:hypothetical protein
MLMADIIQIRRDAAADWTSVDPTLAQGEMGYETDTGLLKFGDGLTAWSALSYFGGSGAGYPQHTLQENITVESYESYVVSGPFDLNGFTLTLNGRMVIL